MVPVPFLDDVLRARALQLLVSRTLRAHGRTYGSAKVAPLYGDTRGLVEGCAVFVVLLPIRLLLFPVRKFLAWVMAVKHLARDFAESLLLGRALDAALAAGRLPEGADASALRAEADLVRRAFENALAGIDVALLGSVLRRSLRSVAGLPRAAIAAVQRLRRRDDAADPGAELSGAQQRAVDEGTSRLRAVLDTPEIAAMLARFDAKLAENLAVLDERTR